MLDAFLGGLPAGARPALEFRHESWFSTDVYDVLRARGAALCIAESEDLATPLEATASWGYLRLRRQDYDEADVAAWAERISAQGWSEAYVFFKHEDEGKGPKLAAQLIAALELLRPQKRESRRIWTSVLHRTTHGVQSPTWREQSQAERSPSGWSRSR